MATSQEMYDQAVHLLGRMQSKLSESEFQKERHQEAQDLYSRYYYEGCLLEKLLADSADTLDTFSNKMTEITTKLKQGANKEELKGMLQRFSEEHTVIRREVEKKEKALDSTIPGAKEILETTISAHQECVRSLMAACSLGIQAYTLLVESDIQAQKEQEQQNSDTR